MGMFGNEVISILEINVQLSGTHSKGKLASGFPSVKGRVKTLSGHEKKNYTRGSLLKFYPVGEEGEDIWVYWDRERLLNRGNTGGRVL
jgi:hypothetical protein